MIGEKSAPGEGAPQEATEIQKQYIEDSACCQDRGGADRHDAARGLLVLQAKIARLIEVDPERATEFEALLRAIARALGKIVGGAS